MDSIDTTDSAANSTPSPLITFPLPSIRSENRCSNHSDSQSLQSFLSVTPLIAIARLRNSAQMPLRRSRRKIPKRGSVSSINSPFASPARSDGPPVPPPRPQLPRTISLLARSGLTTFNDVLPIGFPAEYNMCYRNAALSLLMNVAPFVGYLDYFPVRERNKSDNVLIELGEMARVYWSAGSDRRRRKRLKGVIDKLWAHLLCLQYDNLSETVGWGPFLDSEQREMQQDAGEFLENLLVNGDAESQYREKKDRTEYNAVVEANFQVRTACVGNCEASKTRREQLDQTRLWTVNIDHGKGAVGGTLEDAIRTTMTNEIDLTCGKCRDLGREGKLGRIWYRLRDAPEILFIRIARFERSRRGRLYKKCNNEVVVPEILDLTPYLEESDKQAGVEAKYRLRGAISHAGTINNGHFVSHVQGQNRQWYRLDDETVTDSSIAILNSDAAKFGKHKFTPYVLAYTKIFEGEVSAGPLPPPSTSSPQPSPSPTSASKSSLDVKFRVKVDVPGQKPFAMTRRLKGLNAGALESQNIGLQMDIVDADGNTVLRVDPITFQLARAAAAASESSGPSRGGSPTTTPRKADAGKGLVTPSPSPKKNEKTMMTTTATTTTRSKGEERARVAKAKVKANAVAS